MLNINYYKIIYKGDVLKKIFIIVTLLLFTQTGCEKLSDTEKIHNHILTFNAVSYDMNITIKSNKNENTYKFSVKTHQNGSCTLEVKEPENLSRIFTMFAADTTEQANKAISDIVTYDNIAENPILLNTFLNNYLIDQKKQIKKTVNGDYNIRVVIVKSNYYFDVQEVIFDGKTLKPKGMNIYTKDNEQIVESQINETY